MVTGEDLDWQAGDIDVVRQVVEAFRDRDVARLRMLFDEQSEFTSTIGPSKEGTYRGRDGIERYIAATSTTCSTTGTVRTSATSMPGTVRWCSSTGSWARERAAASPIDEEAAIVWMVRDGKVLRGKVYLDPEEALASVE